MLNFAIETAREAGQILLEKFGRKINVSFKGDIDLVTEADLASEKLIIEKIRSHYPKHAILAEESGESIAVAGGDTRWKWIIDPLDGTTNYAHGYPCFWVTIALERDGEIVVGATFDPTRDEMFSAEKGCGANLNNRRIRVSDTEKLGDALIVTGFPYNFKEKESFAKHLTDFLLHSRGVRRDGSAAIDMAYVACGGSTVFGKKDYIRGTLPPETFYRRSRLDELLIMTVRRLASMRPDCASNNLIHAQCGSFRKD